MIKAMRIVENAKSLSTLWQNRVSNERRALHGLGGALGSTIRNVVRVSETWSFERLEEGARGRGRFSDDKQSQQRKRRKK